MNAALIMFWIAVLGCALIAALYFFQDRLLYFPDQASIAQMTSAGLRSWPSELEFRGLVSEPVGVTRGTAIVFHGNAGHAGYRAFYSSSLTPLGLRVILAEYPGYGPRSGKLGEASLVADAVETLSLAHRQYGEPILLIGESLGAGVAAAAGARNSSQVAGLLLITPWNKLEQVARYHYRWLPVRWLLRDQYDTISNLAGFEKPVAVVVAQNDSIVPAQLGVSLQEALQAPKKLITLSSSDHNSWPAHVDQNWWRSAIEFLMKKTP